MQNILLCLHGWGGSKESFTELRTALQGSDIKLLTPDLPGFGDTPDPKTPLSVNDYANWVEQYLVDQLGDTEYKLSLLGHSHGGRISIVLANRPKDSRFNAPVHLYLCASAGIRHPRHFKRILGLTLAKTGKVLLSIPGLSKLQPLGKKFLYKLVRVHDYETASPVMQQTLAKASAENLRPLLSKITTPTDIFWGTDDTMTPYSDGQTMDKEIPNSTLHTFKGVRHRVHRDRAREIAAEIQKTINL